MYFLQNDKFWGDRCRIGLQLRQTKLFPDNKVQVPEICFLPRVRASFLEDKLCRLAKSPTKIVTSLWHPSRSACYKPASLPSAGQLATRWPACHQPASLPPAGQLATSRPACHQPASAATSRPALPPAGQVATSRPGCHQPPASLPSNSMYSLHIIRRC